MFLAAAGCATQPNVLYDFDDDGSLDANDCNSIDPLVHPGADDPYGDGIDQDCDGSDGIDGDGDYYPANVEVQGEPFYDCNDNDAAVNPGAEEVPNDSIDNDCSGDEAVDADGDGYPVPGDCDDRPEDADGDGVADGYPIHPDALELCNGGVDDDCNSASNENIDGDGDTWSTCSGDCNDQDNLVAPEMSVELCDGRDTNCDGLVDNGCETCDLEVLSPLESIQGAIDGSQPGDVICVSPGTYLQSVYVSDPAVRLIGIAGPRRTIIDAGGTEKVVEVASQESSVPVSIEGFTLTGGHGQGAGLSIVYVPQFTEIRDMVVTGNSAGSEAGVWLFGSSATLIDVVVSNNVAVYAGAGISIWAGDGQGTSTVTMARVTVAGNQAGDPLHWGNSASSGRGAGIDVLGSVSLTIQDSTIRNNYALAAGQQQGTGGGISLGGPVGSQGASTVVLRDVSLTENFASTYGGALYVGQSYGHTGTSTISLDNVLIQGNTAGADGGGVWLADGFVADLDHVAMINNSANAGAGGALAGNQVDASFTNVTIHGNEAALGGGLYLEGGVPTFENVTVSGNQSWGTGGGLYLLGCSATLTNVLITGNYADDPAGGFGGAIENGAGVSRYDMGTSYAAGSPSLSHCAAWNNHSPYEGAFNNYGGMDDPTGQAGNLAVDPILVPTSWQQPYHLDLGSPLVDAGDATILDPDGTLSDIGAFGGPRADAWDLDRDGYPSWWQPGAYDFTVYPAEGLDCDDLDADIHPGANEIADDGVDSDCDGI